MCRSGWLFITASPTYGQSIRGPLCQITEIAQNQLISRAQLPLLLAKVKLSLFAQLLFEWFGLDLATLKGQWLAVDGKELCGNVQPGLTRGEACISVVSQAQETIIGQAYYQGEKESEKLAVRNLLTEKGLLNQWLSLDALHLNSLTVNAINKESGSYVIGLKANQQLLYRNCGHAGCHCQRGLPRHRQTRP